MGLAGAQAALAGKVAVVIGGAAGFLGRGVTLGLAQAGVTVACCDNDPDGLALIADEAAALGGKVYPVCADVTEPDQLDAFFDQVAAGFERVDILVNVAGGVERGLFEFSSRAANARDIRLNYGYVIDACHRVLPLLRRSGDGGSIINFTSIEAHRGAATYAVYAGAKAATTNFSRALAVELGKEQIRVNCIATDTTQARASNAALSPEDFARLAELAPDA
ncbi:MAG: SDR family oxidoreductase, partial [Novosphingobium sp.]